MPIRRKRPENQEPIEATFTEGAGDILDWDSTEEMSTSIEGTLGSILSAAGGAIGGIAGGLLGTGKDKGGGPSPGQIAYLQQQAIAKAAEEERQRKAQAQAQMTQTLMFVLLGAVGLGAAYFIFKKK